MKRERGIEKIEHFCCIILRHNQSMKIVKFDNMCGAGKPGIMAQTHHAVDDELLTDR